MNKLIRISIILILFVLSNCQTKSVIKSVENAEFWDSYAPRVRLKSMDFTAYSYKFKLKKYTFISTSFQGGKAESCVVESGNYKKRKNLISLNPETKLCCDLGMLGDRRLIIPYDVIHCTDENALYVSKDSLSKSKIIDLEFNTRYMNFKRNEGLILVDSNRRKSFVRLMEDH